jgi:hypothetical protein
MRHPFTAGVGRMPPEKLELQLALASGHASTAGVPRQMVASAVEFAIDKDLQALNRIEVVGNDLVVSQRDLVPLFQKEDDLENAYGIKDTGVQKGICIAQPEIVTEEKVGRHELAQLVHVT